MANQNLALKIIFDARDKATAALNKMRGGSLSLAKAFGSANTELKKLESTQKKVDGFRKAGTELRQLNQALEVNRQRVKEMGAAIKASDAPTKAQNAEFKKLIQSTQSLSKKQEAAQANFRKLGQELNQSGFNTKKMGAEQKRLSSDMQKATTESNKQRAALQKLNEAQAKYNKMKGWQSSATDVGIKTGAAGTAINLGIGKTVMDAMTEEEAMLGIVKQVDGLKNDDNSLNKDAIAKMRQEVQRLSMELPLSTVEVMQLYTAGARMDVPRHELEGYVRTAAMAATAFDVDNVEEMAESLGKINKNFKLSAEEGQQLADVINYLDDNAISKGDGIIDYLNRVSGIAGVAKISDKNMAALGSTLMTLGAQAEDSATAVTAIMTRLASAPNKKPVREALESIGLDAKNVQKGMVTDAQGTIMSIIDAMKAMPEEQQISLMAQMVGTEHVKTMAKLVSNTEEWNRQIKLANSQEAMGSMSREFETRMTGMTAKWQIFKNSLFNASAGTGMVLADTISSVLGKLTSMLSVMGLWMQAHPKLTGFIVKTVAGIGLLLTGISALAFGFAAIIGPIAVLKLSWATLAIKGASIVGIIGKLGQVFMLLGRALLLNPIGIAITLIAGGALLIYKNWNSLKGWFIGFIRNIDNLFANNPILNFVFPLIGIPRLIIANWATLKQWLSGLVQSIDGLFQNNPILNYVLPLIGIPRLIINNWASITPYFARLWEALKSLFSGGILSLSAKILNWSPIGLFYSAFSKVLSWFGIELPAKFTSFGRMIIDGLVGGIKEGFKALKSTWATVNSYMPDFMKKKMDIHSPSRVMSKLGGHIMGGLGLGINAGAKGLADTFDRATSFLDQNRHANLIPAGQASALNAGTTNANMRNQSSERIEININVHGVGGGQALGLEQEIAAAVTKVLDERDRKQARAARSSYIDKD